MSRPADSITRKCLTDQELDKLWVEICEEVLDPVYKNWTHGNLRTYIKGCHRPVCKLGQREYHRSKFGFSPRNSRMEELDHYTRYFWIEASIQIEMETSSILERITSDTSIERSSA